MKKTRGRVSLYNLNTAVRFVNATFESDILHCRAERKEEDFMQIVVAIIGIVAAALLLYYVYILMKGDEQK